MKLVDKISNQIIDDLLGSCESGPDYNTLLGALLNMGLISVKTYNNPERDKLERMYDKIEGRLLNNIDAHIFCCSSCGRWCEVSSEEADEGICNDCYEEENY